MQDKNQFSNFDLLAPMPRYSKSDIIKRNVTYIIAILFPLQQSTFHFMIHSDVLHMSSDHHSNLNGSPSSRSSNNGAGSIGDSDIENDAFLASSHLNQTFQDTNYNDLQDHNFIALYDFSMQNVNTSWAIINDLFPSISTTAVAEKPFINEMNDQTLSFPSLTSPQTTTTATADAVALTSQENSITFSPPSSPISPHSVLQHGLQINEQRSLPPATARTLYSPIPVTSSCLRLLPDDDGNIPTCNNETNENANQHDKQLKRKKTTVSMQKPKKKQKKVQPTATGLNDGRDNNSSSASIDKSKKGKVGNNDAERRQRRLLKNKVAAKECRERKKQRVEALKERISQLEEENKRLRDTVNYLSERLSHYETATNSNA